MNLKILQNFYQWDERMNNVSIILVIDGWRKRVLVSKDLSEQRVVKHPVMWLKDLETTVYEFKFTGYNSQNERVFECDKPQQGLYNVE